MAHRVQESGNCFVFDFPKKGHFGDHTVVPGGKALMSVFILLGLAGIGVGVLGLGVHQNWWTAGALTQANRVENISMITGGIGGLICVALGGVGLVRQMNHDGYRLLYPENSLGQMLKQNSYSYVLQNNGKYSKVVKGENNHGEILEADLTLDDAFALDDKGLKYVTTSLIPTQFLQAKAWIFTQTDDPQIRDEVSKILRDLRFISNPNTYLLPYGANYTPANGAAAKKWAVYYILRDRHTNQRF